MTERNLRKNCHVRSKIWLEVDGAPFFGNGRLTVLRAIDRTGSIQGAAKDTGISYRKIWGAIRDMERCLDTPLVETQRGGRQGGGTSLTDAARDLMRYFVSLEERFRETVDGRFHGLLGFFLDDRSAQSADRLFHLGGEFRDEAF